MLAIGHSARDTYAMLLRRGVPLEAKPFQLGVRIEQPQEQVNHACYGRFADHPALGAADYQLVAHAGSRDLFTFCMCPGGYIMPSRQRARLFRHQRHEREPPRHTVCQQRPRRHDRPGRSREPASPGRRPLPAAASNGWRTWRAERNYTAPIQWARDFLKGRPSHGKFPCSYERGIAPTNLELILPPLVLEALQRGLPVMDRRMRGRSSRTPPCPAPSRAAARRCRIPRDERTRQSPAVAGLVPLRRGGRLRGRDHQRGRRWASHGTGHRRPLRSVTPLECGVPPAPINQSPKLSKSRHAAARHPEPMKMMAQALARL